MKRRFLALLLAVVTMFSMTACGGGSSSTPAEDVDTTVALDWRLGLNGKMTDNDSNKPSVDKFVGLIQSGSENQRLNVTVYPNAQLGNETAMLDQLMMGDMEIGSISINVLGTVWPDLLAFSLPFAFANQDVLWGMLNDPELWQAMCDIVEADGTTVLLGFTTTPPRGFQNATRPIRNADDMKGIKLRVMAGQIYTDTFNALGCSTSVIDSSEVYTALQQGTVEAEDYALSAFYDNRFWEIEKYSTQINAMYSMTTLVMSRAAFDKLSPEEQEMVRAAGKEIGAITKQTCETIINQAAEKCRAEGVEVIMNDELTNEERYSFVDATAGIWDQYSSEITPEFFELFKQTRTDVMTELGLI